MTYICEPTPYDKKNGPYSDKASVMSIKASPFIGKTSPYSKIDNIYGEVEYCPVLLQENEALLLLENGLMIKI